MEPTTQNTPTQERETNTITLEFSKSVIVHYGYIKAREIRDLAKSEDGQRYLIETLIVSFDGISENIYDKVMDLRYEDYMQVDNALAALIKVLEEKKN